jgi:cell division protease FtsH
MSANPRLTSHRKQSTRADVARRIGEFLGAVGRRFTRDPVSTFLLVISVALTITFFTLLGDIGPSATGREVSLSDLSQLASGQQVRSATLLDHDHQVVAFTSTGLKLYANYPSSDAATLQIYGALVKGGADVRIDLQSGKSALTIVVQFLIPILLLVFLFAFFTRQVRDGSGGIAAFSNSVARPASARARRRSPSSRSQAPAKP